MHAQDFHFNVNKVTLAAIKFFSLVPSGVVALQMMLCS